MRNLLKKICPIVLTTLILLTALPSCGKKTKPEAASIQETLVTEPPRKQRENLQTILVVCLDQFDMPQNSGTHRNRSQADFIMVLIIDESQGKTMALQLNPDTVVSFTVPGKSETLEIPLGQVYSYGSGGSDSCLNIKNAVSKLLKGVTMNHYMTFTAESIAIVNDMLGGVTVNAAENLPESFGEESVTLMGKDAVTFFCYRDDEDASNEAHMDRQRQYMSLMLSPFTQNAQQEDFLTKLTLQLGDALSTDLTLSQMLQMMQSLGSYALEETVATIPGSAVKTDGQFQFRVDAQNLDQTVNRLFFE